MPDRRRPDRHNPDQRRLDRRNPDHGNPDHGRPVHGNPHHGNPHHGNPDQRRAPAPRLASLLGGLCCLLAPATAGLAQAAKSTAQPAAGQSRPAPGQAIGFDRNDYPGDASMARLRSIFAFTGYWLTNPPGETVNTWVGKRRTLRDAGWGFLVLANGRLDADILKAAKRGITPSAQGRTDAAVAVAAAQHEGFPPHTILFLDQEEGGRLLTEQAGYLLGWTEAVAAAGFRPGVYASGQPVPDDPGTTIDTIRDIRARVKTGHLHEIAIFDALDQCPPAPGCTVHPKPLSAALDPDLVAWQYAQSPRRPEITRSCAASYAADGNCYAPGIPAIFLDINTARSADPSEGR